MRKLFVIGMLLCFASPCFAVDEWAKGEPSEERMSADISAYISANNEALDRLLAGYQTVRLHYLSTASLTVSAGAVTCSNAAGTVRRFRRNTAPVTATWADLDTGSMGSSVTYYVYAVGDADTTTFAVNLSTSATAPSGATYYKRLGSFATTAEGHIARVSDGFAKAVVGHGEVAHGGTIPLPAGFAEDECRWIASPRVVRTEWGVSESFIRYYTTGRVVTAEWYATAGDGLAMSPVAGTANYLIIGVRDGE